MQIEPGLEQLKRCFAWIFFLTCILNACVMFGMRMFISDYLSMLSAIEVAGNRQVLAQVRGPHARPPSAAPPPVPAPRPPLNADANGTLLFLRALDRGLPSRISPPHVCVRDARLAPVPRRSSTGWCSW
jgi:hypothetical protein